jgi:aldose sugar dehydrogenase
MWVVPAAGVLSLILAMQVVETRGCSTDSPRPSPSPSPAPSPEPTDEVFTTRDGIRFRIETMVRTLEVPWSMAFAPDGRLFVTERPGRVRILNPSASTIDPALTLDGVFAQGEAGLLGIAIDPEFQQNHWLYLYYSAAVAGE